MKKSKKSTRAPSVSPRRSKRQTGEEPEYLPGSEIEILKALVVKNKGSAKLNLKATAYDKSSKAAAKVDEVNNSPVEANHPAKPKEDDADVNDNADEVEIIWRNKHSRRKD